MPKLKVYATRIGFHDAVVAAPNQKAALAAWDIRENLFAQGAAEVTEDPQAVKAANAEPGVVLRRAAGTSDPYKTAPAPPKAPKVEKKPPKSQATADKPAAPAPKPDRAPLDEAEKALAAFDKQAQRRRESLERDLKNERRALERERDRLSRVYRGAGGD
jgi:cell division septation protein DedD